MVIHQEGKTNVVHYAYCLDEDLQDEGIKVSAFVGHSMGAAALGVYSKMSKLPSSIVLIASPTRIDGVFSRFAKMLKLSKRSAGVLCQIAEERTGHKMSEVSLSSLQLPYKTKVLAFHDEDDETIPFSDFEILKKLNLNIELVVTKGLGHSRIKNDASVMKKIVEHLGQDF